MTTTNVLVNRTGTNWTVDVTPCALDPDVNIKDFVVLIAGSVVPTNSFNKTTSTTLTYVGASLPSNTQVEIRRKTPNLAKALALLGSRVRSSDWNSEFDRVYRHFEEYDLNGAGSPTQTALPKDDAFGIIWDGDTVYPPTRNSLYDFLTTVALLDSPAFTGNPTVPTQLTGDNSTKVASTAYVKNNLALYAVIASPNFTGAPTVPTPNPGENSTIIPNTSWVRTFVSSSLSPYVLNSSLVSTLAAYAPVNSPAFTGSPTAPTPPTINLTATNVANQNYVHTSNRPFVSASRITSGQTIPHATLTTLIFNNEIVDTNTAYNPSTGEFTVPTGLGGTYSVSGFIVLDNLVSGLTVELAVNGSIVRRAGQGQASGDSFQVLAIHGLITVSAGDIITVRVTQTNTGSASRALLAGTNLNWLTIHRLNV
ncbi:hypothetical protein [Arthronema virus TR020]|uniref:C1q domain-containing protein n=1 Tax=Arthronema virus TR020 TaxID=2736280 RepID=A0A7G3WH44_9CAUD|nr:hypothetical protein [Arthronema virus TR020]